MCHLLTFVGLSHLDTNVFANEAWNEIGRTWEVDAGKVGFFNPIHTPLNESFKSVEVENGVRVSGHEGLVVHKPTLAEPTLLDLLPVRLRRIVLGKHLESFLRVFHRFEEFFSVHVIEFLKFGHVAEKIQLLGKKVLNQNLGRLRTTLEDLKAGLVGESKEKVSGAEVGVAEFVDLNVEGVLLAQLHQAL